VVLATGARWAGVRQLPRAQTPALMRRVAWHLLKRWRAGWLARAGRVMVGG